MTYLISRSYAFSIPCLSSTIYPTSCDLDRVGSKVDYVVALETIQSIRKKSNTFSCSYVRYSIDKEYLLLAAVNKFAVQILRFFAGTT